MTYTVLRLLAFAVPLALLLLLGFEPWIAAVLAAIIGLSLSYIVLRRPREQVASNLYDRRHGNRTTDTADEDAEDASTDGAVSSAPASTATKPETTETDAEASVSESPTER